MVLSGCGNQPSLLDRTSPDREKITSIEVVIPQDKLLIQYSGSGATAGGAAFGLVGVLIGAAIDSGINASRKKSIRNIVDATKDYDFKEKFIKKLRIAEKQSPLAGTVLITSLSKDEVGKIKVNTPRLAISYVLSNDRNKLVVSAWANYLDPKSMEKDAKEEELYSDPNSLRIDDGDDVDKRYKHMYKSFHDLSPLGIEGSIKEKTQFLAENPHILINALDRGMNEVIDLFLNDFGSNTYRQKIAIEENPTGILLLNNQYIGKMKKVDTQNDKVLLLSGENKPLISIYTPNSFVGVGFGDDEPYLGL